MHCYWCDREMEIQPKSIHCRCGQSISIDKYRPDDITYGPRATLFPATKYWDEQMLRHWIRYAKFFIKARVALGLLNEEAAAIQDARIEAQADELRQQWARSIPNRIRRFFSRLVGR